MRSAKFNAYQIDRSAGSFVSYGKSSGAGDPVFRSSLKLSPTASPFRGSGLLFNLARYHYSTRKCNISHASGLIARQPRAPIAPTLCFAELYVLARGNIYVNSCWKCTGFPLKRAFTVESLNEAIAISRPLASSISLNTVRQSLGRLWLTLIETRDKHWSLTNRVFHRGFFAEITRLIANYIRRRHKMQSSIFVCIARRREKRAALKAPVNSRIILDTRDVSVVV